MVISWRRCLERFADSVRPGIYLKLQLLLATRRSSTQGFQSEFGRKGSSQAILSSTGQQGSLMPSFLLWTDDSLRHFNIFRA